MELSVRSARAVLPGLGLIAAVLIAAGCGEETVDQGQLEADIASQLSHDAGVEASELSVSCPDDIPKKEGEKFTCTVTPPNGDKVTVDGTVTDGGDSFQASVAAGQFIASVDGKKIASDLTADLSKKLDLSANRFTVTCPSGQPKQEGAKFTCTLTLADGQKGKIDVTMTGGDSFKYVLPPGQFQ